MTSNGGKHLQKFGRASDGNWLGVGQYTVKTGDNISRSHGWVYKFSEQGDSIWSRTFPTPLMPDEFPNGGILYGVGTLSSGNIVAGGLADDDITKYGWVVKLTNDGCMDTLFCTTSAIHEWEQLSLVTKETMRVYPNPTDGLVTIEISHPQKGILTLTDVYGGVVFTEVFRYGESSMTIHTETLPNGVYFVSFSNGEGKIFMKKVVVQR